MKSVQTLLTATTLFLILIILTASAGASQKINYQGYLTDALGEPVTDNNYQVFFTLYDITGGPLWSSGPVTVAVNSGLFNYILGSSTDLPDSVFGQGDLYLGIKVGEDPEIDPRTLLTSAPGAAVATNLYGGSFETKEGGMVFKNVNGDSAMVFIAGPSSHLLRIVPPEPCVPPDPCLPAIEISANNENRIDVYYPGEEAEAGIVQIGAGTDVGGFISIHNAEPLLAEGIRLSGSAANSNTITMFGGVHDAEYKLLEMTSKTSEGGKISFFDEEMIDQRELLTINGSPEVGIGIAGFNPQPEPPGFPAFELGINSAKDSPGSFFRLNSPVTGLLDEPMISMTTSPESGPKIELFNPSSTLPNDPYIRMGFEPSPFNTAKLDFFAVSSSNPYDPCIRMGIEPSPFHTGRLEFFAPEGLMPNDPYIRMGIEPSPFYSGRLEFFAPNGTMPNDPYIRMGTEPSPFNPGGAFSILDPAHDVVMEMMGNYTDGASIKMFQPQPEPPGQEAISMSVNPTSGSSIKMFQPQPEPPGHELIAMSVMNTSGPSLVMFNPQPEPPGQVALEMATSARGAGGYLATYNTTDSVRSVLVGGNLSFYDMADINGANAGIGIRPTGSELELYGPMPPYGGLPAVISMQADENGAYVGIGVDTSSEALFVVGNIVATGNITALTDTKYKSNIGPIHNALDKVLSLRGVTYDMRRDEYPQYRFTDKRQIGFLADEVNEVVPEIVLENEDGPFSVDYSRISALLVEAVKELKAENDRQAELIEKLQQEINELK
jgi:hypothetical protein